MLEVNNFFYGMDNAGDRREKRQEKTEEPCYTFEEAVNLVGSGKFHNFQLIICGLCLMSVITETMNAGIFIPIAKCDFEMTQAEQGFIASAGFLGIVLSSHMWGFLADTWGRKKVIRFAISTSIVLSIISVFSYSVWMLALFRVLVGFMISGCQACAFSYVGEFHGSSSRARTVANLSIFLPLGMVYLPAVAIGILPWEMNFMAFGFNFQSWRIFILSSSIPSIIALFFLPLLPESPKYLLIQGDEASAIKVLQKTFKWNTGKHFDEYPVKRISLEVKGGNLSNVNGVCDALRLVWTQTIPIFYKVRVLHSLNLLFQMFLIFFIAHGIFVWVPTVMTSLVAISDNKNNDLTLCEMIQDTTISTSRNSTTSTLQCLADIQTYQILVIMGTLFTAFYGLVGILIKPLGKKRLLFLWMIITGSFGVALYWTKGFYLNIVLLIGFLGLGNGGGVVSTYSVDFFPTNINAMAVCFVLMSGRLGAVIGSNIIGAFFMQHCDIVFISCGVATISGALISLFLPKLADKTQIVK